MSDGERLLSTTSGYDPVRLAIGRLFATASAHQREVWTALLALVALAFLYSHLLAPRLAAFAKQRAAAHRRAAADAQRARAETASGDADAREAQRQARLEQLQRAHDDAARVAAAERAERERRKRLAKLELLEHADELAGHRLNRDTKTKSTSTSSSSSSSQKQKPKKYVPSNRFNPLAPGSGGGGRFRPSRPAKRGG